MSPGAVRVLLTVLGGFGLHCRDDRVVVAPAGQRLLTYLAIARRQTTRSSVAATLWPDGTDGQAAANLRSTLRRLPRPDQVSLVTAGPSHLSLPPWVGVDLWEAQNLLGHVDDIGTEDAVRLLQEDLLPGWATDWLDGEREHHRQRRLHALERLCRRHRAAGDYEQAMTLGLAAAGGEPLRETAQRELIEVHLAEGNHAEALRQYQSYRLRLREELGLAPSPAIRALVAPLLGRPADAPQPAEARRAGRPDRLGRPADAPQPAQQRRAR